MDEKKLAITAVQKKLIGKTLTYKEIYAIMDEIAHNRFGNILTTYFAASGYSKGFTNEELFFLTKAMVETGEKLHFKGIVADKHSIGGVPGTRTTLIVVPIIAAAGFTIPKSSSRAITTAGGTADDMELLSPVTFTKEKIYEIVKKIHGCIVWGGSFHIAPADDILIQVEQPLLFESYDKIIVSIMAKKVAFGSNHVVIDIPFGDSLKVQKKSDAEILKDKFHYIAKKFDIKLDTYIHEMLQPAGYGIGPVLECRAAFRVLEQTPDKPQDLEEHALILAGKLLDLCSQDCPVHIKEKVAKHFPDGNAWATYLLKSGKALEKMKEIIQAQGGNPKITSATLTEHIGKYMYEVPAKKSGKIKKINSKNITALVSILGAPTQKGSGIYFSKRVGDKIEKNDILYTLYSESRYHLNEAEESLRYFPIMDIE